MRLLFKIILALLLLLVLGVGIFQYNSAYKTKIEKFKAKKYAKSLHIRENLRLLFDKVQYDFKLEEANNISKLNLLYKNYTPNMDLEKISKLLNQNLRYGKYEIFLINKNFIISDSTYKPDIGYNLGEFKVVRELLQSVFKNKIDIDISAPKLDSASMKLKRYLIRLSPDKKYILQIAYVLDIKSLLKSEYNRYSKEPLSLEILLANKYSIQPINLSSKEHKKESLNKSWQNTIEFLKEIKPLVKDKSKVNQLINTDIKSKKIYFNQELSKLFKDDLIDYLDMKSHIYKVYSITNGLFNESSETKIIIKTIYDAKELQNSLDKLKYLYILIFIVIFLLLSLVYLFMLLHQKNKALLKQNKQFIADTVHQIRTPLTNILLNSQMIQRNQTKSNYNHTNNIDQINASINMLSNSYEDLAYIISYDTIEYNPSNLNISEILKNRIAFFQTIAKVNFKNLKSNIEDDIYYQINQIEFERIIDNNISNAIKYASPNKTIEINLYQKDKIIIEFISFGEPIKDSAKIFDKNYRENNSKRGLGLGLNMVKNICIKYNISYEVRYEEKYKYGQNIFSYQL